jgi:iron complex transport system permease protein
VGAVHIAPDAILRAAFDPHGLSATERVIWLEVRLPRVLAAGLVGAAFAMAGLMFQGLFRNPMADPYVTGSSGGAILGAALAAQGYGVSL